MGSSTSHVRGKANKIAQALIPIIVQCGKCEHFVNKYAVNDPRVNANPSLASYGE